MYSNFTPRAAKHAPKGINKDYIVSFGQQMVMRQIKEMFDEHFFTKNALLLKEEIIKLKEELDVTEHVDALIAGESDLSEEFKNKAANIFPKVLFLSPFVK